MVPQPGDHAVAGDFRLLHAEIDAAMLDEHVELLERAVVEQKLDALPRRQLAPAMLRLAALLAAAGARPIPPDFQLFQDFFHGNRRPLACDAPVTVNSMGSSLGKWLRRKAATGPASARAVPAIKWH